MDINSLLLIRMKISSSLSKEALTPFTYFVGELMQLLFVFDAVAICFGLAPQTHTGLVRVHSFYLVAITANNSGVALLSLWHIIGVVKPLSVI